MGWFCASELLLPRIARFVTTTRCKSLIEPKVFGEVPKDLVGRRADPDAAPIRMSRHVEHGPR